MPIYERDSTIVSTRAQDREINRILGKIQKRLNKKRYICLYPGCNRNAIQSHSQQKEGQLRAIAKKREVYSLFRNKYMAFKTSQPEVFIQMKKIGIAEASTFPGFCANHDRNLFLEIEAKPLDQNNKKQSFLFLFRAFCYECSQKRKQFDWYSQYVEQTKNILPEENLAFSMA